MSSARAWIAARSMRQRLLLAALAGGLGALGLAPFNLPLLALAGFAGLAILVAGANSNRMAALVGLAGGTGYFALALHWIVEPFFVDPWRHGWMAPFALVFLAGGLALFWAAAAWAARHFGPTPGLRLGLFTVTLALAELARAYVLSGFPWAHPGHIWLGGQMMVLSAWLGPHGLTVLTLGLSSGLAAGLIWHRALLLLSPATLGAAFALSSMVPSAPEPAGDAAIVRLVQPNAPQHLKWLPEMVPVFFERSLRLTAEPPQQDREPDLVIWPETALPALLRHSEDWRAAIGEAAGEARIIVGGQRLETDGTARNSLFLLEEDGALAAIYDKHRLVPFGEYIPLSGMARAAGLRGLAEVMGEGYSPGEGPVELDLGALGTVFPMICYETIFPQFIRRAERPDWMVQITNDAWFGEFSGPYQHLELAQLRAAEQGLPLLRAANTGVSAVIDARGQVIASLPLGQHGALDAALPPALPATLYARSGDSPVGVLLIFLFGLLLWRSGQIGIDPGRQRP